MQAKTVIGLEDPFRPVKTLGERRKDVRGTGETARPAPGQLLDASGFERAGRLLRKLMQPRRARRSDAPPACAVARPVHNFVAVRRLS